MTKPEELANAKALTVERGTTHGDFHENGRISQEIKKIFRKSTGWTRLAMHQREALDQIAMKASRILSGNPDFKDHWDDIAGYAVKGGEPRK